MWTIGGMNRPGRLYTPLDFLRPRGFTSSFWASGSIFEQRQTDTFKRRFGIRLLEHRNTEPYSHNTHLFVCPLYSILMYSRYLSHASSPIIAIRRPPQLSEA